MLTEDIDKNTWTLFNLEMKCSDDPKTNKCIIIATYVSKIDNERSTQGGFEFQRTNEYQTS